MGQMEGAGAEACGFAGVRRGAGGSGSVPGLPRRHVGRMSRRSPERGRRRHGGACWLGVLGGVWGFSGDAELELVRSRWWVCVCSLKLKARS